MSKLMVKNLLLTTLLVTMFGSASISQRPKVYRKGDAPVAPMITKDTVNKKPQKVKDEKKKDTICHCERDLTFDPTTRIALNKNETGNPPYTGKCVTFYSNNKMEMQLSFVNGKEEGTWFYFYENGIPKIIKSYAEGKPHGTWTAFEQDSSIASINNYHLGIKNGPQMFYVGKQTKEGYRITGKKTESYVMGVREGKFEEFYEDGTLKREVNYKNNKYDGPYLKYSKDSVLLIEKDYKEGEIEGKDNSYFDDGTIAYKTTYLKGKKEGEWVFNNEDGTPYKTESYSKGKKDGEWKEYYINGKLKSEIIYKKDKVISKKEYNKFGDLVE